MQDGIQSALEAFASQSDLTRFLAVACADWLIYIVGLLALGTFLVRRDRVTLAVVVRYALLLVVIYLASKVLAGVFSDPRPYLVTHTRPLAPVAADNGFPSDHVLLASAFTAVLWWFDRRMLIVGAALTVLILVGRLAIGAHHTIDVLGSVGIVVVAFALILRLPLPAAWNRPWFRVGHSDEASASAPTVEAR